MGTLADYFKARKELKKHKEEINRYNKAWSKVRKEQADRLALDGLKYGVIA